MMNFKYLLKKKSYTILLKYLKISYV